MTAKIAATMRTIVQNQFTWNNDLKKGVLLNDLSPAILAMSVRVALMIIIIIMMSDQCSVNASCTQLAKIAMVIVNPSVVFIGTINNKIPIKDGMMNFR